MSWARALYFKHLKNPDGPSMNKKNSTMSGLRPYPRALSPSGSILGRVRSDTPATNMTCWEEYEEEEVNEVKREFKIKLLDIYNGYRAKLIPWLI
jgi:hypothetical protein